jgi:hypothetical protein
LIRFNKTVVAEGYCDVSWFPDRGSTPPRLAASPTSAPGHRPGAL